MDLGWAAAADWDYRATRFRELVCRERVVMMELVPSDIWARWPELRDEWIALPRHGNVLDALEPIPATDPARRDGVLLRYAALDWTTRSLSLESTHAHAVAASFGAQLASVFQLVLDRVAEERRELFLQPFAYIDLDKELRVGFECGARMRPPETKLDQRSFVFVVGKLWASMLDRHPETRLGKILHRCIDPNPRARFSTLEKLRMACLDLSAPVGLRSGDRLAAWYLLEEALGWHAMGDEKRARDRFQQSLKYEHYQRLATMGARGLEESVLIGALGRKLNTFVDPPRSEPPPLGPVAPPPPALRPPPPMTPAREAYLEGRTLFLQRKLHEAHACFRSATLLDPMLVEAQLLRREVERTLSRVRATTGMSTSMPIDVPASLREVRELVVAGRIKEAIGVLGLERYAANEDAALFRARLLALDGQPERAASAFAAIDGTHREEAQLGLARVTIDRGKPEAALAILGRLLASKPRDLGALEARARCFELLGRTDETNAAMQAFVAAVELASDVRLSRSR